MYHNLSQKIFCIGLGMRATIIDDIQIYNAVTVSSKHVCFVAKLNQQVVCKRLPSESLEEIILKPIYSLNNLDIDGDNYPYFYDDFPSNSSQSVSCSGGQYGNFECKNADPGYYVDTIAAVSQTPCVEGYTTFAESSTSALDCNISNSGYFIENSSSIPCSLGSYQPLVDSESCLLADLGYYVDTIAAVSQTPADPGYYVDTIAAVSQTPCAPGSYINYSIDRNLNSCIDSEPGYYSVGKSSNATICDKGSYQDLSGQDNCKLAPLGHFIELTGATLPIPCPIGTFQDKIGMSFCKIPPPGSFSDIIGANDYKICPSGTYLNSTSSNIMGKCIDAAKGYYSQGNWSEPLPCMTGSYQNNIQKSYCIAVSPGYYGSAHIGAISQLPCPPGSYQPQPSQISCVITPINYYNDGYGATKPIPCPQRGTNIFIGQINTINCFLDGDGDGISDSIDSFSKINDEYTNLLFIDFSLLGSFLASIILILDNKNKNKNED